MGSVNFFGGFTMFASVSDTSDLLKKSLLANYLIYLNYALGKLFELRKVVKKFKKEGGRGLLEFPATACDDPYEILTK